MPWAWVVMRAREGVAASWQVYALIAVILAVCVVVTWQMSKKG